MKAINQKNCFWQANPTETDFRYMWILTIPAIEREERLRLEADDIHTPYDEMGGPLGEIQDPVVPTDPASTTGPLVT